MTLYKNCINILFTYFNSYEKIKYAVANVATPIEINIPKFCEASSAEDDWKARSKSSSYVSSLPTIKSRNISRADALWYNSSNSFVASLPAVSTKDWGPPGCFVLNLVTSITRPWIIIHVSLEYCLIVSSNFAV